MLNGVLLGEMRINFFRGNAGKICVKRIQMNARELDEVLRTFSCALPKSYSCINFKFPSRKNCNCEIKKCNRESEE